MAPHEAPLRTVTVTIPIPSPALSPNGRAHRRALAAARKRQRAATANLTREALPTLTGYCWPTADLLVRWYGATANCLRLDSDNIFGYLKGAIDGLRDGGLIKDDRGVTWLPPVRAVDKANPRVELVVTKTEPEKGTP